MAATARTSPHRDALYARIPDGELGIGGGCHAAARWRLVPQTGPRVCHTWGTRTQSEVPHCVEARGARMEGGPGDPDVITVRHWSRMEHTTIGGLLYPGRGPVRPASGRRPERATASWRRARR